MSNSIWKMPDIKPEENKLIFAQHQCRRDGNIDYFIWDIHEFIDAIRKDSIRWCYLDELLAQADKAERLQKAVNEALISIGTAAILDGVYAKKYADAKINLIKKLTQGNK